MIKWIKQIVERTPEDSLPVGHLCCSLGMVSMLPSSYISLLLTLPENKALLKATSIPSFPWNSRLHWTRFSLMPYRWSSVPFIQCLFLKFDEIGGPTTQDTVRSQMSTSLNRILFKIKRLFRHDSINPSGRILGIMTNHGKDFCAFSNLTHWYLIPPPIF